MMLACTPRAAPKVPAPRESPPPPTAVASEPEVAVVPARVPADPAELVEFDLSKLAFGRCRQDQPDEGPFVVGPEVEGWREGEPLWVMTNAGGAVRAAAGKSFEYCGAGLSAPEAVTSDESEETCVKAVAIVTEAPLRCDEALGAGAAAKYMVDGGPPLDFVFAFHRRHRPPTPVAMQFEVRVDAVCQDPDKDFDEPGAMIPVTDAAAPIDRSLFDKQIAALRKRRWRAVRVTLADGSEPLHVLHAVEHGRSVKSAQLSVVRELADGSGQALVARADRAWPDSFLLRDHQCGLPFSLPLPALAFMHADRLHWVTVEDVNAKIVGRVWEVGATLRRVAVLPIALTSPKW
ncbi:hypothetical protein [Nannocystis bainbridge]|uniref:hypothetical protein n=1 Tax=Nannocystis bainbridge TaxID=2995303 RepID=UPI00233006AE|nr:hypothetical protein [Nannocystis bainbridge]